jgi:hypothetical protein
MAASRPSDQVGSRCSITTERAPPNRKIAYAHDPDAESTDVFPAVDAAAKGGLRAAARGSR